MSQPLSDKEIAFIASHSGQWPPTDRLLATIAADREELYRLESERLKAVYRVAALEEALREAREEWPEPCRAEVQDGRVVDDFSCYTHPNQLCRRIDSLLSGDTR